MIRGLQLNDIGQFKLEKQYLWKLPDMATWYSAGYRDLVVTSDVAIVRPDGVGAGSARPYVEQGRSKTRILNNTVDRLDYCIALGFDIIFQIGVCEPPLRGSSSDSHLMGGMGFEAGITEHTVYTAENIHEEIEFADHVLDRIGDKLKGLMLGLEPSTGASLNMQALLAEHVRKRGYEGLLLTNSIGEAKKIIEKKYPNGSLPYDILEAYSINNDQQDADKFIADWRKAVRTGRAVPNGDGFNITEDNADKVIPIITGEPGQDGFIQFMDLYSGDEHGPDRLKDWMHRSASA